MLPANNNLTFRWMQPPEGAETERTNIRTTTMIFTCGGGDDDENEEMDRTAKQGGQIVKHFDHLLYGVG
jgi:hypothetical protein